MKTKILSLSLAAVAALPGMTVAQGTYLSAPDGNPTNALIVAPGGNVGIGTTTPQASLDVYGGLKCRTDFVMRQEAAPENQKAWRQYVDGASYYLATLDDNNFNENLAFRVTRSGQTIVSAAFLQGNVGIGTDSPNAKLDVVGDAVVTGNVKLALGTGSAGEGRFQAISYGDVYGLTLNSTERVWDIVSITSSSRDYFAIQDHTAGVNRLLITEDGNVCIGDRFPQAKLDVDGKINCTILELTSDRNQKQDFAAVDARSVFDRLVGLPISTWAYTNDAKIRHIGPVAQDWKAAYPELGSDDKHIAAGDLASVALAAIQGVNEKLTESLKEKDAEIAALKKELRTLKTDHANFATRFDKLEKLMANAGEEKVNEETFALADKQTADWETANRRLSTLIKKGLAEISED